MASLFSMLFAIKTPDILPKAKASIYSIPEELAINLQA